MKKKGTLHIELPVNTPFDLKNRNTMEKVILIQLQKWSDTLYAKGIDIGTIITRWSDE